MLTQKQKDLLILIHERMAQGQIAPSFEEMKQALDLHSKSGIFRLINALVERGYLQRLPHRARALEVIRLPDGYIPSENDHTEMATKIRATMKSNTVHDRGQGAYDVTSIPLYGKIAAGTPIEAIRDEGQSIEIPAAMLGRGEHYALRVDGDSMIKAGIHDHDIVVVRRDETASNGMIVVALVDDAEVTLKRFQRQGGNIILVPENDDYEPRVLDASRVKVQGHLVSLFRKYDK